MINSLALFWEDKLLGKKLFNAVFESGLTFYLNLYQILYNDRKESFFTTVTGSDSGDLLVR
jgi:hypothetical protein